MIRGTLAILGVLTCAGCLAPIDLGQSRTDGGSTTETDAGDAGPLLPEDAGFGPSAISAGPHHTCGLSADGGTFCWGRNQYGELGHSGAPTGLPSRAAISDLVEVVAGLQSTCGRKADGTLWCWGRVQGEDQEFLMSPPAQVTSVGPDVRDLEMSKWSALVRRSDGSLWGYSHGASQQMVDGGVVQHSGFGDGYTVCLVREDASAWCIGDNYDGSLGDGTTVNSDTFVRVKVSAPVRQISVGGDFACALTTAGEVWCWGSNHLGQTGSAQSAQNCNASAIGATPCNPTPVKVNGLPAPARRIATGYDFAFALLSDGTVWGWGGNDYYELGGPTAGTCTSVLGTDPCSPIPVKVPVEGLISITAGSYHACGCAADGHAWCWGDSAEGKLGSMDVSMTERRNAPVKVHDFRCRF